MKETKRSKQRVADHGEVFTAEREVKAMCDLVAQECERIDSRFLEPACGDGNFLAEILRRKLAVVKRVYGKSAYDYEKNAVLAVTSIYGVDIMHDNVDACRARLFDIWNKEYTKVCKADANDEAREAVKYILSQNILYGNALSLMTVDENQEDTDIPIIFPEWSFITNTPFIKRRDFRFDVLLKENDEEENYMQYSLFADDAATNSEFWEFDPVTNEQIPKPIKEYSQIHYRRVFEYGN
jgi:hypothetical protein